MSNRIQVCRRRFAWKVGDTYLGVWERRSPREWAHSSFKEVPLLSFVIFRPEVVERKKNPR